MAKIDQKLVVCALDLERLRQSLAVKEDLSSLKKTYKNFGSEIPDINTSSFWNKKNNIEEVKLLHSPMFRKKIDIVVKYLIKKRGKVLDIGFGNGIVESYLEEMESKIKKWGIDLSNKSVHALREKTKGIYVAGNLLNLPLKNNFFDFILVLDVLEHISPHNTLTAYSKIYGVLKKQGTIIVSVPLNEGLDKMLSKGINPNGHVRLYTPELLKAELKLFGFRIFREYYLYAFRDNYFLKNLIVKLFPFEFRKPNLMIVFARK